MPRVYERKFDWDEARRRHDAGESYASIARDLGVTNGAVRFACDDEAREKAAEFQRNWVRQAKCIDCGAQVTRTSKETETFRRCRACSARHLSTSAREGELWCPACATWKPDEEFPHDASSSPARRGRHGHCRPCNTRARREYRHRNPEREREYDREYRRRRRAAAWPGSLLRSADTKKAGT